MAEKLQIKNQESLNHSSPDIAKNLEKIRRSLEKESTKAEKDTANNKELSTKAQELAKQSTEFGQPKEQPKSPINLQEQKDEHFAQTMQKTRMQLKPSERVFSKIIHSKAVDKTSDVIAKTVARPSAILGAFSFSALGSLIIYVVARQNGYALDSYYYMYVLLVIGAIAGLLIDVLHTVVKKLRQN